MNSRAAILFTVVLGASLSPVAGMKLPALFSDHAVLQKRDQVPVWGDADPGETVNIAIAGKSATARADDSGHWRATLDLSDAASGPFTLEVSGHDKASASDVLIGEVWVCSGQSNMDWAISRTLNAAKIIAASTNPQLRVFTPERQTSATPLRDIKGKWQVAGPNATGGFPGVGYWFGKDLQEALHQPVGIVHISWGGSPVEAWTSHEALAGDADLAAGSAKMRRVTEDQPEKLRSYQAALTAWREKYQREAQPPADLQQYIDPKASTADWRPVRLPGKLADAGLPDAGAIWVRRTFTLTPEMCVGPLFINLGVVRDFDQCYINGIKIGETSAATAGGLTARTYYMEGPGVRPGEVTVALRIEAPAGAAGLTADDFSIDGVSLAGTWLAKAEYTLPAASDDARRDYPAPQSTAQTESKTPSYLFNGMVNPVIPYAMRGVAWYQGEDNAPRGFQYATALKLMIDDWRRRWGEGDFPFYICQLPRYGKVSAQPEESAWAELREAETKVSQLPNVGQAVLIDLGEPGDIHPRDKTEVGARLARLALARTYHQPVVSSGPIYSGMRIEGDKIRVTFRETAGGLVAHLLPTTYQEKTVSAATEPLVLPSPKSRVQGFAVCGADGKWQWADAMISGDDVLVSSSAVPHPVAVRYGWANSPITNLYNAAGLPAAPFRTDAHPLKTQNTRYGL